MLTINLLRPFYYEKGDRDGNPPEWGRRDYLPDWRWIRDRRRKVLFDTYAAAQRLECSLSWCHRPRFKSGSNCLEHWGR
jgi:hypothetical protein